MTWLSLNLKQLRGLLLNNLHLQLRQYKSNLVQLLLPVVCMLYVRLLQWMDDVVVDHLNLNDEIRHHQQAPWFPATLFGYQSAQSGVGFFFNQTPAQIPSDVWYSVPKNDSYALTAIEGIERSQFVWRDKQGNMQLSYTKPPILTRFNTSQEIDLALYHLEQHYQDNKSIPILGSYDVLTWTPEKLDYVVQYDFVKAAATDVRNQMFVAATDDVSKFCLELQLISNSRGCQNVIVSGLMNEVHSKFSKDLIGKSIVTKVQQMPYPEIPYSIHMNLKEILAVFFFPLMLNMLLPVFMYKLVLEKRNKLKEMMKLMGMNTCNYVCSNIVYMFVFFFLTVLFFSLVGGVGFKYRVLTQTHWFLLVLVFFGAGCTIISMAHFLSAFIKDEMLAIVVGYFYVLFLPVIGTVLNYYGLFLAVLGFLILRRSVMKDGAWGWKPALLLETLPISDAFFHLAEGCLTMHCESSFSALWKNTDLLIAVIMMYVMAGVYFVIGLYLDQVLPQDWGKRKAPWFCCQCCVRPLAERCCARAAVLPNEPDPDEDVDVKVLRDQILEGKLNPEDTSVLVKGIVKVFKRNFAVNGVYFGVNRNEIFGLLGPNGAGKTTLIRCLVGLYAQTSGEAYVAGRSISDEMGVIRRSLGYCPQFDIFWEDLTPRQTLLFFSRLKGVPISEENAHVERIMVATGLMRPEDLTTNKCVSCGKSLLSYLWPIEKQVRHLSGGMKRRLSIAISLCGDPAVVILDEPTTGLDPTTKRQIWNIILREKETKSILITTHSMEEADVLSDTIGIMSKGNLVCCGSSLSLKARYGTGYTLEVNFENRKEDVIDFVVDTLSKYRSRVIKEFGNSITWEICPDFEDVSAPTRVRVSEIFDALRRNEKAVGITDFQLNQTTLEDVFLNVIEKAERAEIEDEKKRSKLTEPEEGEIPSQGPNLMSPLVQSPSPSVGVVVGEEEESAFLLDTDQTRTCWNRFVDCVGLKETFFQTWFLLKKNFRLTYRDWAASIGLCLSPLISIFCIFLLAFIVVKNDVILHPTPLELDIPRCQQWGRDPCYTLAYATEGYDFGETVLQHVIGVVGLESDDVKNFTTCKGMTEWIEANVNRTSLGVCFSSSAEDFGSIGYTIFFNDTTLDLNEADSSNPLRPMQVAIDNAIIYLKRRAAGQKNVPLKSIDARFKRLPTLQSRHDGQAVVFSAVGPNLFSLTTMLLLVVALQRLVHEKEAHLKEGMRVIGMRKCPYCCSWMVIFVIFSFGMALVVLLGGMAFVIYPFIFGNQFIILMLFFMFNLSLVCLAFMLSAFLPTVRSAVVVGFIVFAITCILNQFLANGNLISMFMDKNAPKAISLIFELFYPSWNFAKALCDIIRQTTRSFDPVAGTWTRPAGYHFADLMKESVEVYDFGLVFRTQPTLYSFLFLLWNCVLYLVIFWFAEEIGGAIRYLRTVIYWIRRGRSGGGKQKELPEDLFEDMDVDVKREWDLVHDEDNQDELKIMNLRKTFHMFGVRSTKAVRRCTLGLSRQCCLGLLGHNGAGKSTIIRLICGTHNPSGGDVEVCGTSIYDDLPYVRKVIGVCFQEDILFDKLTAAEHLRLFGELKGLKRKDLTREIELRLRQVSLWHVRNEFAGTFSGGMKRRLSVAISCISSPTVLLLDEPTTGMDPYSKREVWHLIYKMKGRKSILLTTHSMEEADALSDKIAILTNGDLKCVGNSLHLKGKFGSCYVLKLLPKQGMGERMMRVLEEFHVRPVVEDGEERSSGTAKFKFFPSEFDTLAKLLPVLEDEMENEDGCIKAFGLTHTTLEDVYVSVTKKEDIGFSRARPSSSSGSASPSSSSQPISVYDKEDSQESEGEMLAEPSYQRLTFQPVTQPKSSTDSRIN